MKPAHFLFALLAAAGAVGPAWAGVPQGRDPIEATRPQEVTDRLIIKFKDSAPAAKGAARVPAIGATRMASMREAGRQFGLSMKELHTTATGAHVVELDKKVGRADAEKLAREIMRRDPTVAYAEPDLILRPMLTPNDTRYGEQWHYFETTGGMRANLAWDKATGSGIYVAVIDTGYRPHADLSGKIIGGYDFISSATIANDGGGRDSDARDPGDWENVGECGGGQPTTAQSSSWHGTHVAGTIAAATNNGSGVAGVAYNARVVPVRVLGKCGGYTSDISDGIIWASGGTVSGAPSNPYRARVINLSLGGSGPCSTTTQSAINSARSRGTVVVVAAGNSNVDAANSNPANCAGVITVASTTRAGGRAYYSNYGSVVDVSAPGGDSKGYILSTLNSGTTTPGADSYAWYQGTSMATPHVAGTVALMLSKNTALTVDEVESKLKSTARAFPVACSGCGAGIIDAARAVDASATTTATTTSMNESEANDSMGSADPVTASGTIITGTMGSKTDSDYFVVQLPAGRTLTATLTMSNAQNDYDLYAYSNTGAVLAYSENGSGATDTVRVTNTGTTTSPRYLRVRFYSGNFGGSLSSYTLKVTW